MVEEVLPNLYKIEVPLPRNPLKALNSYVVKGGSRTLVIDTGMNREECRQAMTFSLRELGVDLRKTDFFITHLHADHLGLVSSLTTDTSKIYFNQPDAEAVNLGSQGEKNSDFAARNGFPDDELQKAISNHPGRIYSSKGHLDFHIVKEGDVISMGDYSFRCYETPGHTAGHMCLYEPSKKILVSGDHILIDITPNISLWSDNVNPLKQYLSSLEKVYSLDVKLVLPGHRRLFTSYRERIEELKHHHQTRASEVLSILEEGEKNAYQVASRITWDMDYESWELFPPSQKWFAFSEAVAHLKYLEEKGGVEKQTRGHDTIFLLKK